MTTTTKQLTGYIRVSRKNGRSGPSFISPDVQRESIEAWARAHGHDPKAISWIEEIDRSAGEGKRRPEFEALLARVSAGDVIAVWKISRFGRSLIESALRIQKIEEAGGTVESATEGAQSKLTRNIMLAIAEDELERLTETWALAQEKALAAGVWFGVPPFGYERKQKRSRLTEHPKWGPVVREAFRIAGAEGIGAAVAYLRELAPRRYWTTASVRKMLSSRVYLGEVWVGGDKTERTVVSEIDGKPPHPPLTTPADFAAAQSTPRARRAAGDYLLSGIVSCAECSSGLVGQLQHVNGRTYRRLRCANPACKGGSSISADKLTELVRAELKALLADESWRGHFVPGDLSAASKALEAARGAVERHWDRDDTLPGWQPALESKTDALDRAQATFDQVAGEVARHVELPTPAELDDDATLRATLLAIRPVIRVARGRGEITDRVTWDWLAACAFEDEPRVAAA